MRPILVSVGRLNFYSYGFFTAIGFIVAGLLVNYLARKKRLITKKREYFLIDALLFSLVCALIGARLLYIILYTFIFKLQPLALSGDFLSGGFVFYGGLATGLAAFAYWIRREEENIMPWFDIAIIGVLTGLGLSEIGGYLNDNDVVHLAGMVGSLALAGLMYLRFITEKRAGQTFWPGLFLMLLLFFFLGFWRTEKILWVGLNLTQWASLLGMAGFSYFTLRSLKNP